MPFGNRKNILEDLFGSVSIVLIKKYRSSGNLKFNNLSLFQSLKFRIFMEQKTLQFLLSLILLQILWAYGFIYVMIRQRRMILLVNSPRGLI